MSLDEELVRHRISRVRRETRRRLATVASVQMLSPQMLRIWFASSDFHDFESAGADDHVKLFVPDGDGIAARDYTPRSFDAAAGTLAIDFALHEAGPATRWALTAAPGDAIGIGGPRGSTVVADDFDWYLLAGDETAIPSIARRLEELRADVPVVAVILVDGPEDRPPVPQRPGLTLVWSHRSDGGGDGALLRRAIDGATLPAGEGFVWIAAEAQAARDLRAYVIDTLGHPRGWTKASGYWQAGTAGAHTKIED